VGAPLGLHRLGALTLQAAVRDCQRFEREAPFMDFVGRVPGEESRGQCDHRGHLAKAGDTASARATASSSRQVAPKGTDSDAAATTKGPSDRLRSRHFSLSALCTSPTRSREPITSRSKKAPPHAATTTGGRYHTYGRPRLYAHLWHAASRARSATLASPVRIKVCGRECLNGNPRFIMCWSGPPRPRPTPGPLVPTSALWRLRHLRTLEGRRCRVPTSRSVGLVYSLLKATGGRTRDVGGAETILKRCLVGRQDLMIVTRRAGCQKAISPDIPRPRAKTTTRLDLASFPSFMRRLPTSLAQTSRGSRVSHGPATVEMAQGCLYCELVRQSKGASSFGKVPYRSHENSVYLSLLTFAGTVHTPQYSELGWPFYKIRREPELGTARTERTSCPSADRLPVLSTVTGEKP